MLYEAGTRIEILYGEDLKLRELKNLAQGSRAENTVDLRCEAGSV